MYTNEIKIAHISTRVSFAFLGRYLKVYLHITSTNTNTVHLLLINHKRLLVETDKIISNSSGGSGGCGVLLLNC